VVTVLLGALIIWFGFVKNSFLFLVLSIVLIAAAVLYRKGISQDNLVWPHYLILSIISTGMQLLFLFALIFDEELLILPYMILLIFIPHILINISLLFQNAFILKRASSLPVQSPASQSSSTKLSKEILISSNKITPLLGAIISQDMALVRIALQEHPEHLNTAYAQNGNTPLHVAALNGQTEIVRFLLEQPGIDKTIKNKDGKTAFDLAQEKGFAEIAGLLNA
ncbi:MAG: ankyrin repeat domain-containing protein, partial [Elusimicrobiaceae bacterium]|nr:ankyrin repeat domain-containing protein [Elusimicrobiaceae bacterium]